MRPSTFENQPNYMCSINAPTDETLARINADWNGSLYEHEMFNFTLMEYAYQISAQYDHQLHK